MKIFKYLILILAFSLLLTACSQNSVPKPVSELVGTYGDVTFETAEIEKVYNFTSGVYTDNGESGLYAEAALIVSGKIVSVDEVSVEVTLPMEETIPAEESESGKEEKRTVYVPVTAYIQLLTLKCDDVLHNINGEVKKGDEIRILNKVSSRMWDEQATPLFEGDECILLLKSSYDANDVMKIHDRGFAKYLLFDARNGVFKKTDKGYLTSSAQEFAVGGEEAVNASEEDWVELSENIKRCYKNAESYVTAMQGMYYVKDAKSKVENNIKYYYEKK